VIFTILRQNNDRQLTCPYVCANSDLCTVDNTCPRSSQAAEPTSRAVKLGLPVGCRGLRLRPTRWWPESGSWFLFVVFTSFYSVFVFVLYYILPEWRNKQLYKQVLT